jgi:hypothetical protein
VSPREAQCSLILRNHWDWADELVASVCGLTAAQVAGLREELEGT